MATDSLAGIQVVATAPKVNHFLFADDLILFGKATSDEAIKLKEVLNVYCNASGQWINHEKSYVYFGKKCPGVVKENIKIILEVNNETLKDKYLGLPSDVGRTKNGTFGYIKDRVWKRLQGWMEKTLSGGGKEILIKSVIQAIPTYSMAVFKLPRGIIDQISAMVRKFWWGSRKGERKTAWVAWDDMVMPKYRGGLGFRDMEIFNLALLSRQVWRILHDPESLSARTLKAIYFPNTDILHAVVGSNPSQIWRSLCEGRDMLKLGLIRRIGDDLTTNIWTDNWIPRDHILKPICCVHNPDEVDTPLLVSELICPVNRKWKKEVLEQHFLPMDVEAILQIPISFIRQSDFWSWHYDDKGMFSVRSAYKMILDTKRRRENYFDGIAEQSSSEVDEKGWKSLWGIKVPSKVRIFAWRLARASLPTGEVRAHRNMTNTHICSICNAATDDWRHSLLECNMAASVWALKDNDIADLVYGEHSAEPHQWLFSLSEHLNQA
jgi:hypothetical protein